MSSIIIITVRVVVVLSSVTWRFTVSRRRSSYPVVHSRFNIFMCWLSVLASQFVTDPGPRLLSAKTLAKFAPMV